MHKGPDLENDPDFPNGVTGWNANPALKGELISLLLLASWVTVIVSMATGRYGGQLMFCMTDITTRSSKASGTQYIYLYVTKVTATLLVNKPIDFAT